MTTDHYARARGLLRATEAALIAVLASQAEQLRWSFQIVGTDRWAKDKEAKLARKEYERVQKLLKGLKDSGQRSSPQTADRMNLASDVGGGA